MNPSIILWVDLGDEKNHPGWRVIGKARLPGGRVRIGLVPDDEEMRGLFDVVASSAELHPIRDSGVVQYSIFQNADFAQPLIEPLSPMACEDDDHSGFKRAIEELKKLSDDERRRFYYGEFIDEDSEETSGETMDEKRKKAYEYIEQKIQDIPLHNDPFSAVPLAWQRFIEIDIADNGGWLFRPKDSAQLTEEDIEELLNRLEAEARHWQIPEDDEGNSNG